MLEDHAGDIIRKTRQGRGVPASRVAAAAGLALEELGRLEDAGPRDRALPWEDVGRLLGLNGKKLEGIATGWLPSPKNLSAWGGLERMESDEGGMAVNCFLVWDAETREAALFDTGWSARQIEAAIQGNGVRPRHLFLTHSHHDHVAALPAIRRAYPAMRLHPSIKQAPPEAVVLGNTKIRLRSTPGHAADGVTYVIDRGEEGVPEIAVVGDAIFAGSIGGAPDHFELALAKIREEILSLPGPTLICPGHGPVTTVEEELEHNPFF